MVCVLFYGFNLRTINCSNQSPPGFWYLKTLIGKLFFTLVGVLTDNELDGFCNLVCVQSVVGEDTNALNLGIQV